MLEGVTTTGHALLAPVALGGLVGLAFAVEFRRRHLEAPGTGPYVRLMLASAGLSFSYFALLLVPGRTAVIVADYVYLACSLLTVASSSSSPSNTPETARHSPGHASRSCTATSACTCRSSPRTSSTAGSAPTSRSCRSRGSLSSTAH